MNNSIEIVNHQISNPNQEHFSKEYEDSCEYNGVRRNSMGTAEVSRESREMVPYQNELQEKESQIQMLLEKLQTKIIMDTNDEIAKVTIECEKRIEDYKNVILELEENLQHQRDQSEKHLAAISEIELENEKLRAEVKRLKEELNTKNKNPVKNSQNSRLSSFSIEPLSPNKIAGKKRMSLIFGDKAEELNILQLHENLKNENAQDQILINELESKIELLEETIEHEQKRNKDLEYLISNLKDTLDITKRNLNDRESERQEFIRKIETLKEENDTLSLQSERDKAKIDGVIMFCKLIENGSLSRSELQDRIYEIPNLITTYLLGETNNFNFSCDSPKRRSESPSRSDDSDNKRTWNTGPPGEEITEIKGRVEKIYDMLSKILPNANEENILQHLDQDNTATTKSTTSRISESPIESKTPNTSMLFSDTNKAGKLDKEKLEAALSNHYSQFVQRAVRNSNSLLWNLKKK